MRIVLITTDTLRNPRGFENTSRVDPFSIVTSIASESGGLTCPPPSASCSISGVAVALNLLLVEDRAVAPVTCRNDRPLAQAYWDR